MRQTPIKIIVVTYSSARDLYGNRYHYAEFYRPALGRGCPVAIKVHGESNARRLAFQLAGEDWDGVLSFDVTLPSREWWRRSKGLRTESTGIVTELRKALKLRPAR